jgi:nucleotide-binding universal stress UspA family protein
LRKRNAIGSLCRKNDHSMLTQPVKEKAMHHEHILVPIDGSEAGQAGLQEAIDLAADLGSTLVLLHVIHDFPLMVEMASEQSYEETQKALRHAGQALLDQAAEVAQTAGVKTQRRLREVKVAPVADIIVEEASAKKCSLIVMGTHGRRGLRRLALGSDAELVLRQAPMPVLLVRQGRS